jgi:Flp pilus assembly protein TadG
MFVARITRRLLRRAARFPRADGGNIAPLLALALLPILGMVGAAVDYSRANCARTSMQAALDSTALMLLKGLASGRSPVRSHQAAELF